MTLTFNVSADDDLPVPAAGARFTSGGKRPLEDASGSSLPPDVGHGIPLLVAVSTP